MKREERDLQQVLVGDGVESAVFDKSRAIEHKVEPGTGFDHTPGESLWETEFHNYVRPADGNVWGRCCTARSKSLTSLCRLQSHPAQYVSGIPSAAILLSISHPIRCSTRCLANVRARISGPMIAL